MISRKFHEHGDTNLSWVYFIKTNLNECRFTYVKQIMLIIKNG